MPGQARQEIWRLSRDPVWRRYFPTILIVLLAVFNDGAMIALSKDRVVASPVPNHWDLRSIFIVGERSRLCPLQHPLPMEGLVLNDAIFLVTTFNWQPTTSGHLVNVCYAHGRNAGGGVGFQGGAGRTCEAFKLRRCSA